jgi:hypothetical protein
MRSRLHFIVLGAIVALLASPARGSAHERSSSHSTWIVRDDHVHITLTVAAHDIASGMLGADPERSSPAAFADAVTSQLETHTPSGPCAPDLSSLRSLTSPPGQLRWEWDVRCHHPITTFSIDSHIFEREAPHHLHVLRVRGLGTTVERLLSGAARSTEITLGGTDTLSLGGAVRMGVEHLLGGWDHLVFLLALVVASTGLRALAVAVTGFTLGHSVTLALATLGWISAPTRWVEALIGMSIVVVALEHVVVPLATDARSGTRSLLAAAFGLIHGLGFAGALTERALPRAELLTTLLGFNVGIELVQLLIAAIAWLVLRWLRRSSPSVAAFASDLAAAAACSCGVYWTITRLA